MEEACKIFIGGLTWNTTKEMLTNEFIKYGEIADSIVMKNMETGQSRGFGFVTFRHPSSAAQAVQQSTHKVDGKIVDVKLSNQKLAAEQKNQKIRNDNCKIFVGGLPHNVTNEEIIQFFSNYGPVKEFKMMFDEAKQKPRGFGFITFEHEDTANQLLLQHYLSFKGKQVEVKPQANNIKQQQIQLQQQQVQQPYFTNVQNNWSVPTAPQIAVPINPAYNMVQNMQPNWQGQVPPASAPIPYNYPTNPDPNAAAIAQPNWNISQYYEQNAQLSGYYPVENTVSYDSYGNPVMTANAANSQLPRKTPSGEFQAGKQQPGAQVFIANRGNYPAKKDLNMNNRDFRAKKSFNQPQPHQGTTPPPGQVSTIPPKNGLYMQVNNSQTNANNFRQSQSYHPYRR